MKKCSSCKLDKPVVDFNKNVTKKDGLNTLCRECSGNRSRKYYSDNREKHKRVVMLRNKEVIKRNAQLVWDYKLSNPCVDCGESDPIVLELDHVRGKKLKDISKFIQNGSSVSKLTAELKKCDVRCANCHRRRTAKTQNWYTYLAPKL